MPNEFQISELQNDNGLLKQRIARIRADGPRQTVG